MNLFRKISDKKKRICIKKLSTSGNLTSDSQAYSCIVDLTLVSLNIREFTSY